MRREVGDYDEGKGLGRDPPCVSIVVPCFNERCFIGSFLESVRHQQYPREKLEVLVVDGGSTDGTRDIIAEYAAADDRIRLLANPGRSKPRALNLGIAAASGDVIIRMDAHAEYPEEYVARCLTVLAASGADNVGGFRATVPGEDTVLGWALAVSIGSRAGSGGAVYRTGASTERWVDTVFGGCYWREVFDEVGMFDERLERGQDREFNERLLRRGGRILYSPDIVCTYYARSRWSTFLPWVFVSGMTPFYASRLIGRRIWSFRNAVPPLFLVGAVGLGVMSLASEMARGPWLAAMGLYVLFIGMVSAFETVRRGRPGRLVHLAAAYAATHWVYGAGALWGMVAVRDSRKPWARA